MKHKLFVFLMLVSIFRDISSHPSKAETLSTVQINVPSYTRHNELIGEKFDGAYNKNDKDFQASQDVAKIDTYVGDVFIKGKTAIEERQDKPNIIKDMKLENEKNVSNPLETKDMKDNQFIRGEHIVNIPNNSKSKIIENQEQTQKEVTQVNENTLGELKDFHKSKEVDDLTLSSTFGKEEETFYVDFSTLKPDTPIYEASRQAFIPLSPNINEEELLKFVHSNDQTTYRQFQVQSPLKEVEKTGGNIESLETLGSSDTTVKATDFNIDDYKYADQAPIRANSYDDSNINRQARLYGLGKTRRRDQRYVGATKIGIPETTKDKFHVIKVYAEKPKSLDPANTYHHIISTQTTRTTDDDSDDFYDFYNKWQEAYNKNNNNINVDRTFEQIPLKEIEKTPAAVEKFIVHNDETLKPKHELGNEEKVEDEVNIRDLIRKEIEKKMKNSRALKIKDEQFDNIKRSDNAEHVILVDNVKHQSIDKIDLLDYKINEIENEVNRFKKNATRNFFHNKVDKVFENILRIVKKCNIDEVDMNLNLFDCLKDQTLRTLHAAIFKSNQSVPIIQGFVYLENSLSNLTNYSVQENRQLNYNQKFIQAINMFLNSLSLKVKLPTDLLLSESQPVARGKKDKQGHHLLLLMLLLLAGTLIPIKMSMISMVAGKALMISVVSLTLAVIIGLKKISHAGHGSGHTTYEVIRVPTSGSGHGVGGGPSYISRNLKYTTTPTPGLSEFSAYVNPYSSYATSYDNEHEGEISLNTGDPETKPTEERNYAQPSDDEKNYEEENELSSGGEKHYVLPSVGAKHYALLSTKSNGDEKHSTVPIGGEKHYTVLLSSEGKKHYLPSDDERHYVASGGEKYTPSGGGNDKYYSFGMYGNQEGWVPSPGQAKRRNIKAV